MLSQPLLPVARIYQMALWLPEPPLPPKLGNTSHDNLDNFFRKTELHKIVVITKRRVEMVDGTTIKVSPICRRAINTGDLLTDIH